MLRTLGSLGALTSWVFKILKEPYRTHWEQKSNYKNIWGPQKVSLGLVWNRKIEQKYLG